MENFKKILRLSALIFLMVLASIGIGITGPIPVSPNKRREDNYEVKTEQVEVKKDKLAPFNLDKTTR